MADVRDGAEPHRFLSLEETDDARTSGGDGGRALVPVALPLTLGLAQVGAPGVSAATRNSCTGPVAGQHIYDCTGLLTPTEIATLEADAAAVDRAGRPPSSTCRRVIPRRIRHCRTPLT